MAILPTDITGDATIAQSVLATGRSIAPCLDTLVDPNRATAIAILQRIANEGAGRGNRQIKSQRIGPAQVEYFDVASAFTSDDRAALRALCSAAPVGLPVGSFPLDQPFDSIWPETPDYS